MPVHCLSRGNGLVGHWIFKVKDMVPLPVAAFDIVISFTQLGDVLTHVTVVRFGMLVPVIIWPTVSFARSPLGNPVIVFLALPFPVTEPVVLTIGGFV